MSPSLRPVPPMIAAPRRCRAAHRHPNRVQDIYCTKGVHTCGSRMLENFVSPYDAHVVEQFGRAGAVLLLCNMDQFAMGSSNESSISARYAIHGREAAYRAAPPEPRRRPSRRAWRPRRPGPIPVARPVSLQRSAAPACGRPMGWSRATAWSRSPRPRPGRTLARSAADLALLLNVMAGFDARDSTSVDRPKEDYARALDADLKGLRIGIPREYFAEGLELGVRGRRASRIVVHLPGRGSSRAAIAADAACVPAYYVIAPAEASLTCRASTACAMATERTSTRIWSICTAARAPRASATKKGRILVGTYAVARLLRRLLLAGAEGAPSHRRTFLERSSAAT